MTSEEKMAYARARIQEVVDRHLDDGVAPEVIATALRNVALEYGRGIGLSDAETLAILEHPENVRLH